MKGQEKIQEIIEFYRRRNFEGVREIDYIIMDMAEKNEIDSIDETWNFIRPQIRNDQEWFETYSEV